MRIATALAALDAFGLLCPFLCFGLPLEPTPLALRRRVPAAPTPPRTLGGAGLRQL